MGKPVMLYEGLYQKFAVRRMVGEEKPTAEYFVLDVHNDPLARKAVKVYADAADEVGLNKFATDILMGLLQVSEGGTFYPPGMESLQMTCDVCHDNIEAKTG